MGGKTVVCFEGRHTWSQIINDLYPGVFEFLIKHDIDPMTTTYSIENGTLCVEFDNPQIALLFKLTLT